MISLLVDLVSRLKHEKTEAEIAACEEIPSSDNVVVSSQVKKEVNAGRNMVVATDNISEKGSEMIFGTIVEVFDEEGMTVLDASGQTHFVETSNIVAANSILKGDKVREIIFALDLPLQKLEIFYMFIIDGSVRAVNRRRFRIHQTASNNFHETRQCHKVERENSQYKRNILGAAR